MPANAMNEYIKITKKHMNQYMRFIFGNKFDRQIFEEYLEAYFNARYYDLNGGKNNNTLKTEILSELLKKKQKLIAEESEKKDIIEIKYTMFTHILYFDRVIPTKDLSKTIKSIETLREQILGKKSETFEQELGEMLVENTRQIDVLLESFESNDFYLKVANYNGRNNVKRIGLRYNFKIPLIYSMFAIQKAYGTGITNEDKLFVEYSLVSIQIIKDIIKGNFQRQYIVGLAHTLFKKPQKIERILNIVENPAIQDKLNFKIRYEIYEENKEMVTDLIRRGFRFALIVDDTMEVRLEVLERLDIFSYILLSKEVIGYEEMIENKYRFDNLIEV